MARTIDPDLSADCHATGAVPTAAFAVNETRELTLCAHHVNTHRAQLEDAGYIIVPYGHLQPGQGVGTESTGSHFALEGP